MFTHIIRRYEGENCSKWEGGHPTIIFGILRTFFFTPALKGTVSRDFLTLVFFIKQLLLVPLDMPRKDFEYF